MKYRNFLNSSEICVYLSNFPSDFALWTSALFLGRFSIGGTADKEPCAETEGRTDYSDSLLLHKTLRSHLQGAEGHSTHETIRKFDLKLSTSAAPSLPAYQKHQRSETSCSCVEIFISCLAAPMGGLTLTIVGMKALCLASQQKDSSELLVGFNFNK